MISNDKKQLVSDLKKLVKESDVIWLATDDDREGEAISWHLYEALDLQKKEIKRIVFREITKTAILKAISMPRTIDLDLVNAQQARRILDRLVGFEISPILWKKIKAGLSAGRVQSVAVRFIVEREREIRDFKSESSFKVSANFNVGKGKNLFAELLRNIQNQGDAQTFLEKCIGAEFSIKNLETKPAKKSPAAPFTTSTLQQEASRKLSFSVAQTMALAQGLYEAGKISYMRTDSTNLSEDAIANAQKAIEQNYGKNYVQIRKYTTKSESAQEAHEAIRPTDFSVQTAGANRNEQRLYDLIWKRAIASQMADAQLERTTATVAINPVLYNQTNQKNEKMPDLVAKGEVIKFEGFLKVYLESTDDDEDDEDTKNMLPPLTIGQMLDLNQMNAVERFTRHPPRYTEASLVKKLEEMGIGRPSTYAPTISTIQKRTYVIKEDREGIERKYQELVLKEENITVKTNKENHGAEKSKLFPTDIGMVVNDFLVEHFTRIVDYSFTALVEKEFDDIANGKKEWETMIANFYAGFHKRVEETKGIERENVKKDRNLGKHPQTGIEIKVILGRYGAFVQIGEQTEENPKPQRASLRKGQNLETISLEEALELFKLPRIVGNFESNEMLVAIGKFGPYVRHDSKFYSLTKEDDPFTVTEERAVEIIQLKRKSDSEKLIKSFPEDAEIQVLNGRYGAYIKAGKENVKIPKGKEPKELTYEECLELIQGKTKEEPKAKTAVKAKTVPKKTTKKKK